GAIAAVDPNVNGTVTTIAFSPDCTSAYIGGVFTSVGGTAVKNIAKISTSTGAVDLAFGHNSPGKVDAILYANGHLLVGGYFTKINGSTGTSDSYLASLSPTTGKSDGYADNLGITGTLPNDTTHVYKMWLSPDGTRVALDGVFTSILGQFRRQALILDLGATSVSLDLWYAPVLTQECQVQSEQFYTKSLAWSPDSAYLYIASTGYQGAMLCDSVAKFSSSPNPNQTRIWINKTGGDSLFSVVATSTDVYIGGHERWANNPLGSDSCGTGCVSRPGIGDIDASTGLATPWNPTRSRGHGASDLFLDSLGDLWVSSDAPTGSVKCAGLFHPGICELPRSS
ncbi:MAG TPA: hypothetical protein VEO01_07800, partial [Pseudonocardiaceae bacterium]|nr:hypothetical protein [Pseudonocardiaceae bacterium]